MKGPISFRHKLFSALFSLLTSTKLEADSKLETGTAAPCWVVSQICSRDIKQSLNFFFLLFIGRCKLALPAPDAIVTAGWVVSQICVKNLISR